MEVYNCYFRSGNRDVSINSFIDVQPPEKQPFQSVGLLAHHLQTCHIWQEQDLHPSAIDSFHCIFKDLNCIIIGRSEEGGPVSDVASSDPGGLAVGVKDTDDVFGCAPWSRILWRELWNQRKWLAVSVGLF
ncbi:hypothetical protein MTO96_020022 [Rhipicephalus appendiculatus]